MIKQGFIKEIGELDHKSEKYAFPLCIVLTY